MFQLEMGLTPPGVSILTSILTISPDLILNDALPGNSIYRQKPTPYVVRGLLKFVQDTVEADFIQV